MENVAKYGGICSYFAETCEWEKVFLCDDDEDGWQWLAVCCTTWNNQCAEKWMGNGGKSEWESSKCAHNIEDNRKQ